MTKIVRVEYDNGEEVQVEETNLTKLKNDASRCSLIARRESDLRMAVEIERSELKVDLYFQQKKASLYEERFHKCIGVAALGWMLAGALFLRM